MNIFQVCVNSAIFFLFHSTIWHAFILWAIKMLSNMSLFFFGQNFASYAQRMVTNALTKKTDSVAVTELSVVY